MSAKGPHLYVNKLTQPAVLFSQLMEQIFILIGRDCCALHAWQSSWPDHREKKGKKRFSWLIKIFDLFILVSCPNLFDRIAKYIRVEAGPQHWWPRTSDMQGHRGYGRQRQAPVPRLLRIQIRQVHQQWWLPPSDTRGRHRHGRQRKAPVLPSYCSGSPSLRLTPRSVRSSSIGYISRDREVFPSKTPSIRSEFITHGRRPDSRDESLGPLQWQVRSAEPRHRISTGFDCFT